MKEVGLCGHSISIRPVRGCCRNCYNKYYKSVSIGETSWQELEEQGKVMKAKPRNWTFNFRR